MVRGANGTFCSGGDINGFKEMFETPAPKPGEQDGDRDCIIARFGAIMSRFEALPQTIVMVVEGAAYGGGLGLMCGGDVVLAAADAKFSISETTLGVPPAQIAPFVAQRIGVARTRRLRLTAHRFDGREAERIGLVDQACDGTAALDAALAQVLAGIARCSPQRQRRDQAADPREPHAAARGIARAVGGCVRRLPAQRGGAGRRHGVPGEAQAEVDGNR